MVFFTHVTATDLSKRIFLFLEEKDKADNIIVVFGFRPTTLNCYRKVIIKYSYSLTYDYC